MSFMENMNLLTLVKISKYKSSHKLNRGPKSLDRLRGHPLLSLITSSRRPFLVPSAVEGAREGAAGANKESGGRFAH